MGLLPKAKQLQEECRELFINLVYMVNLQKHYIPFVELKEPFRRGRYYKVYYTVENPKSLEIKKRKAFPFYMEKLIGRPLFYITGNMNLSFSLQPSSVPSYHLEIIPPKGVDIYDFRFEGLGDSREDLRKSRIKQKENDKNRYFDRKLFYISFSPEETKEIRKKMYEEKTPALILNLKINPLLKCLYYLVYLAIFSPLIIKVVNGRVDLSDFIASLALAATIYISASIYAIDKNIVQKFALFHLFITILCLFIEICILKGIS